MTNSPATEYGKRGEETRILMLGWEFPPYFVGGVGTVCHSLTKALVRAGHHVTYIMPRGPDDLKGANSFLNLRIAENELPLAINLKAVDSLLVPYISCDEYDESFLHFLKSGGRGGPMYGQNLIAEARRFAAQALILALTEEFDVIHAQDWMTFPAGIAIQQASGKPLLAHVHITEFDKTGGEHADSRIYAVEREGMMKADLVIAISNFIKNRCIHNYYIPAEKIRVVHNAVDFSQESLQLREQTIKPHEKIVLFLGRVTLQKGPDYFLEAARKVADVDEDVKFIMAGSGDMLPRMIERAAELGIGNRVFFPGFVPRQQADELFRMADLFVMPSVSEPFGLVPMEAMAQGTPAIISKQSGVSEVLNHALKVDFWDINELANKIIALLHYAALHDSLKQHGLVEIKSLSWDTPAQSCVRIYQEAIDRTRGRLGWHRRFGGQGVVQIEGGYL